MNVSAPFIRRPVGTSLLALALLLAGALAFNFLPVAPLPQVELIPTGGVSLNNIAEFIRAGALAVGVGADLVGGDTASITAKARDYVAAVTAARASA